MAKGDAFWRNEARKRSLREAEADGLVADSMAIRLELMRQVDRGDKTLEQAQAELAAIKRKAKRSGQLTRAQAFRQG